LINSTGRLVEVFICFFWFCFHVFKIKKLALWNFIIVENSTLKKQLSLIDALLSSLLNPLEGPSVLNYGNMEFGGAPDFQHYRGVGRSPGIRLGRGTRLSSLNLHPKPTTKGLVHIREHLSVSGQATGTLTHKTHHGPDSGEATTFPHIVFSTPLHGGYIQMALFPETPKLESRNCPETVPVGVPRLWKLISPDCQVWSKRGLNQSYSSLREISTPCCTPDSEVGKRSIPDL
jgi:hypothetical protein